MVTVRTPNGPVELTDRQFEPLALAADHLSTKEIALELDLSPRTVEDHIRAARLKLGVSTRAEAVRLVQDTPYETTRGAKRITPSGDGTPSGPPSEGRFTFHDAGFAEPAPWSGQLFRHSPEWKFRGLGKTALQVLGLAAGAMVLVSSGLVAINELAPLFDGG